MKIREDRNKEEEKERKGEKKNRRDIKDEIEGRRDKRI